MPDSLPASALRTSVRSREAAGWVLDRGCCGDGMACDGDLSRIQRPIGYQACGFERTFGGAIKW